MQKDARKTPIMHHRMSAVISCNGSFLKTGGGPQYRSPNTIVLIMETPKKGAPKFRNPPNPSAICFPSWPHLGP